MLKTIILAIFAFPSIHPGRMGINILFMNANVDLFHDSTKNSSGILTSESNEMDLNILIPVVDNNNHKVVDARFLHAFLQVRRDFTSWIKDRISKYDFIENQDFVLIKYDYLGNLLNDRLPETGESDTQIVAKTDYLLLIDMAKELCMVENNDKGKIARRYFIEKEKELRALKELEDNRKHCLCIPDFSDPAKAARAWADEYEARMKAEKEARLALEAKEKSEKEKRMVQAELNTAIDTIKENEPVIDMFKRSIPREGVLIRESSKYFEQFGYYIGIKNMYPLLQELKYVFRNERGRIEAYQSARNYGLVTYGSDPGDEYWEAKAMTVMITLKGFVKLEELSRKKRDVFKRYGHFYDNV